jgi:transposase-like protein
MAQLNITLNQEEILQLMKGDREGAFALLLQNSLNAILKAESAEQLKADTYERTDERTGYRNGFRDRDLNTRIGTFALQVPKHRDGQPFKTMIFDNYQRSEAALVASMAEMVVNGVSTRKVETVVETLCGVSISKSAVSDLCKDLDEAVNEFKNRPLTSHYPFVTIDATYFKVREDHRVISKAFMIAYAANSEGRRDIIGFGVYANESKETWTHFLQSLKNRGLKDVRIFISDSHEGIKYAISQLFPETPWQRCQCHFTRNILDKAPKKYTEGLRSELQDMFNSDTIKEARVKRDSIIADYKDVAESAMMCLDEGFEDAMTAMVLPKHLRKLFRTSNHIERLNKELKRRSNVIGIFPNADSLNRLMGSVLIELNEKRKGSRPIFYKPTYNEIEAHADRLRVRAKEQQQMMAA